MNTVKVALVQAPSVMGDVSHNCLVFSGLVRQAVASGAKIIVLPEMCITGYLSPSLSHIWHREGRPLSVSPATKVKFQGISPAEIAETVPGPSTDLFCSLARELGVYITVPLCEKVSVQEGGCENGFLVNRGNFDYFNTIAFVSPRGAIVGHYRKLNLWPFVDHSWQTAGRDIVIVDTEYGRIGLAVCFDIHKVLPLYATRHPWAILHCVAWVDNDADSWWSIDLPSKVRAEAGGAYLLSANWSVNDSKTEGAAWYGYGHSSVYSPEGDRLATARSREGAEVVMCDIPVAVANRTLLVNSSTEETKIS